jgi:hypothetical protein
LKFNKEFTKKTINIVTIDDLKLEALDLLKIDVETMEPQVLRGAAETIKKYRPIIMFEAFPATKGQCFIELEKLGYTDIICPTENPADFVTFPNK